MDTERNCPSCQKPLPANAPKGLCPECLIKAGFGTGVAPEPGQPSRTPAFVPPTVAEVAKLFPQFEIVELLGQGGMGAVYKARQPALDRLVALKVLPPHTGGDIGFADRFTREARALAKLSHPNIVTVHEFGQAGGLHYFVMEYVEGLNLRQVEQAGRLSPREALKIIPQICDALQFAHDEGIVHRDIKPENVMLDKKGRVKIADFGLAKILGREPEDFRLTGAKDVMGTPHYMAPEQVEHPQEVDHRADIYSLGVVFYEMLTGELPLGRFQAPSKKVQVDVRLDEVVLHALEKEPERRYQQASQVKTDVETIAGTPPAPSSAAEHLRMAQLRHRLRLKSACFFFSAVCFLIATISFALADNAIAAVLSVVAVVFFSIAGHRHFCAAQQCDATTTDTKEKTADGAAPEPPGGGHPGSTPSMAASAAHDRPVSNWLPHFFTGRSWYVGILLGLALIASLIVWGIWERRMPVSGETVVRVEGKLRQEIEKRLNEVGWRVDGISVSVWPDLKAAECRFGTAWKNNNTSIPFNAAIRVTPQSRNLWLVTGDGEFQFLGFSVDTSAEMGAQQGLVTAIPEPFRYAEPEKADRAASLQRNIAMTVPRASLLPFAQSKPGEFKVALSNGMELEVVAVASSPRSGTVWWRPDGALLTDAPGDKLGGFSTLCPSGTSRAEFVVVVKGAEGLLAEGNAVLGFNPLPQYVASGVLYKDGSLRQRKATVVGFRTAPESLTCKVGLAGGPWERVATWDEAGTLLCNESGDHLELVRSGSGDETCLKLNHKVDPNRFGLRLTARLRNRAYKTARICRVQYGSEPAAQTCAIILGLQDADVVAYELYRLPLRWAQISNIATKPNVPPIEDNSAGLGQVTERVLCSVTAQRPIKAEDLDNCREIEVPAQLEKQGEEQFFHWLAAQGADLLAFAHKQSWDLWAAPKLASVPSTMWEQPAAAELQAALKSGTVGLERAEADAKQGFYSYGLGTNAVFPLTFAFQTSAGGLGLLQITGLAENPQGVKIRYKRVPAFGQTVKLDALSEAERARAVALFNDIEDFGHEFNAAFTARNLAAAQTGTRRLLTLLTNFNVAVKGTGYEFSPGIFDDIAKVRQALDEGDWDKVQQAAGHNEEYGREFRRISSRMVELARQRKPGAATAFGPVLERLIPGKGDANKRFIDFDTGRQFASEEFFGAKSEPGPEETQKWLRQTGIDAVGDTRAQYGGLVGSEMVASPVPSEEWDRLPASRLDYYLTASVPGTPVTMSGKGELPATFVVKTREGARGLLQILGFTNDPPVVKVRYKLVGAARPPAESH